jgi:hypothetical protein
VINEQDFDSKWLKDAIQGIFFCSDLQKPISERKKIFIESFLIFNKTALSMKTLTVQGDFDRIVNLNRLGVNLLQTQ